MKNLVFVLLLGCLFQISIAQQSDNSLRFGVQVGLTNSNILLGGEDAAAHWESINSLLVGGTASLDLGEKFFLQPSIVFTKKGTSLETLFDAKITMTTVEIPILLNWKKEIFDDFVTFAGGGVYLARAIGGQRKNDGEKNKLDFGNDPSDDFEAGDWGLMGNVGMLLPVMGRDLQLQLFYSYGIKDVNPDPDFSAHHMQLRVAATYFLN